MTVATQPKRAPRKKKQMVDDDIYQRNISGTVRMLMFRDGINQQELGEQLGLKQTNVSSRLRGQSRWTIRDLIRLSAVFEVHPAAWFVTDPKEFQLTVPDAFARGEAGISGQTPIAA